MSSFPSLGQASPRPKQYEIQNTDGSGETEDTKAMRLRPFSIHKLFQPQSLKVNLLPNDFQEISFDYQPVFSCSFKVLVDSHGYPISVSGTNLRSRSQMIQMGRVRRSQRGKTEAFLKPFKRINRCDTFIQESHVIADRFQGSGFSTAHNLVITSSHYNLNLMSDVENLIAGHVRGHLHSQNIKIEYFSDFSENFEELFSKVSCHLKDKYRKSEVVRTYLERISKKNPKIRRIKRMSIEVEVIESDRVDLKNVHSQKKFVLGADYFLGLPSNYFLNPSQFRFHPFGSRKQN
eukprot:TRINITY_DN5892_c0_g1_i1.p1 TRINITY_DN5892_c0_g1~~TRINITY_DN5892_c0_g1_i1.p1  ORF type:complete len:308 (-),score=54.82 TRINITY_DN5892_c0_g1_i1:79-951(-)